MPCAGQGFAFLPERTHPGFGNVPKPDPNLRPRVSPSPGAFFMPDFSAGLARLIPADRRRSAAWEPLNKPGRARRVCAGCSVAALASAVWLFQISEPKRIEAPAQASHFAVGYRAHSSRSPLWERTPIRDASAWQMAIRSRSGRRYDLWGRERYALLCISTTRETVRSNGPASRFPV